jgi:methyl-accepting chemotaxis protein
MSALSKLQQLKISTKLSSVVGGALIALCVMGGIAIFATGKIQSLGHDLYSENSQVLGMEMSVSIGIERAIADVHSAPSELNLETLKGKQAHFRAVLGDAKKVLSQNLAGNAAAEVKAGSAGIVTAIDGLETASKNVFDFAASFAQPEAIAALSSTVAPAAAAVQAALKQFHEAAERANAAKAAVIEEMTTTITWITVALASFLVVSLAALAYIIVSRGIVRPISTINGVMTRLSGGDSSVAIPYADRFDEVGDIARAVQVFKDNAIRVLQMETEQKEQRIRTSEQRKADMSRLADGFESAVGKIVEVVSAAAAELEGSSSTLSATAERAQERATAVAAASEEAATNVQSVASASEEMTSSVNEISRQVQESSRVAREAVEQAQKTNDRVGELSKAAARIGDVVELINTIAGQTNLLALNATIEAARAGEAGRGFAVVASEVKALAEQTAKATGEISQQISGIQAATQDSVSAIKEIGDTIGRMSEISSTIAAAVEEQGAATQEISRNIQQAAQGTTEVSSNIADVQRGASEAGAASSQVHSAAQSLSVESNRLKLEVGKFLNSVRAA